MSEKTRGRKKSYEISDRDKHIAISVLQGGTLESVGHQFGLTRTRAQQILKKTLGLVNPELAEQYRWGPGDRTNVTRPSDRMRQHRDVLIPQIRAYSALQS